MDFLARWHGYAAAKQALRFKPESEKHAIIPQAYAAFAADAAETELLLSAEQTAGNETTGLLSDPRKLKLAITRN